MPVIGIRELANQASRLVSQVAKSGEPAIITRHGRAVAMLVPVDSAALEDFVLANAPEFVESRRAADEDLAAGRTRPLADLRAELADAAAAEPPSRAATG